jgi:uncharacterized repeat protein (TIGR04138 family)
VQPEFIISADLPCFYCDYNLRGLTYYGRCPECGNAVKLTFKAIRMGLCPGLGQELETIREFWVKDVADAIGYPDSAVLFVIDSLQLLNKSAGKPVTDSEERQHAARDICQAFRSYAKGYFNSEDEALELLAEWKLNRSEDLGRVIFALVETGFVSVSPEDALSHFDGVFTLGNLFTDERLVAPRSPLEVPGVDTDLSMEEIVAYLRQVRERPPPA